MYYKEEAYPILFIIIHEVHVYFRITHNVYFFRTIVVDMLFLPIPTDHKCKELFCETT